MKKFKILTLTALVLLLVACSSKTKKMSDEDFNKYQKEAQTAISLVNERKTDEFIDLTEKSMGFKKEILEEAYKNLDENGKFVDLVMLRGSMKKIKIQEQLILLSYKRSSMKRRISFLE